MAGKTVTKTIENVDKLFASIIVNGEEHVSERYIAPASVAVSSAPAPKVSQKKTIRSTLPATRSGTDAQATQGEDVYGVELNNILHNFVDRVVTQGLADEITARQSADALLAGFINALNALVPEGASSSNKLVTASQLNVISASVSDIEDLIPSQASDQNQLADKDFVNSSIATNTANFLGTYTTLADIQAIQNPTNNDYAFLQTTDQAGNTQFDRYKYSSENSQWLYEYTLNNSSFTAEQWATINSGLTASSISDAISALAVASVGGSGKYIESISEVNGKIVPVEASIATSVTAGNVHSVSSDAVYNAIQFFKQGSLTPSTNCWIKVCEIGARNYGESIELRLSSVYYNSGNSSHIIRIVEGWLYSYTVDDLAKDLYGIFTKLKICGNNNNNDRMAIYVYYAPNAKNPLYFQAFGKGLGSSLSFTPVIEDPTGKYDNQAEYNLGTDGYYVKGVKVSG